MVVVDQCHLQGLVVAEVVQKDHLHLHLRLPLRDHQEDLHLELQVADLECLDLHQVVVLQLHMVLLQERLQEDKQVVVLDRTSIQEGDTAVVIQVDILIEVDSVVL